MAKLSIQMINGKAFEYALLKEFFEKLKPVSQVRVIQNASHEIAKKCYEYFDEVEQAKYALTASFSVNFLLDLEPRLSNRIDANDVLELELLPDKKGENGDVRDVLAIRSMQKWEIGISAKNNHHAVKHSRLSTDLNFGEKWFGISCSQNYFKQIKPIFNQLSEIRKASKATRLWSSIGDYHSDVYVPVLEAFRDELLSLDKANPVVVAESLIEYLIGSKDFYKVIKGKDKVEIQAFNLRGTLNLACNNTKAKAKVPKLKLPNRLVEVVFLDNSKTTLLVTLNEGWQISFRIHNASSKVEASLKFDINLVSAPHSLFTNHLFLPKS